MSGVKRPRRARSLELTLPAGLTFDDVAWDAETLRVLLKELLPRINLTPSASSRAQSIGLLWAASGLT